MENCWANLCRRNKKLKPQQNTQNRVVIKRPTEEGIGSKYERRLERVEFGSSTYFCKDRNTGEEVACKSIRKNELTTSIDIERVRREVAILSHLPKHPNIISLKDIYEDDHHVHLIMELCQGGNLLNRRPYKERAAASVIKNVVQLVQMCHEHGVMLRDLKPESILFANNMETAPIKVNDFRLSTFFEPGERFHEMVGNPYYMAPEMLNRNYGPEIDIWSAGIILHVLLCGDSPFWGETEHGDAETFIQWDLDFTREPWQNLSDNVKDLVKKMLNPDPRFRLTAQEVLDHPWFQNGNIASNVSLGEAFSVRLQFSAMNKIKKTTLRVIPDHLSVEEVINAVMHDVDTDLDGKANIIKNKWPSFF